MDIVVRYQNDSLQIKLPIKSTCKKLYQDVGKNLGLKAKSMKMIFNGKTIPNDSKLLTDFNLINKSKVLLISTDEKDLTLNKKQKKNSSKKSLTNRNKIPDLNFDIIFKGPPEGCLPGMKSQVNHFPPNPFLTYDREGKLAKLSVESNNSLFIEYEDKKHERLFDVECNQVIDLDKYFDQYVAILLGTDIEKNEQRIFYFIPKQYSDLFKDFFSKQSKNSDNE